ncbi:Vesicle-mediated ER to Golgi transport protein [Mycoemilia scoparia]|uniref:Vesicle-mediated ER to Golgi transport protein n=1 Tax=Mycoemilia scoparia TaxID=417184 RepID=A0A9W8DQX3_9FUNG|nr:Vesicle-mediated ER to Golgi transport protein [Mycoemilia scoparia]
MNFLTGKFSALVSPSSESIQQQQRQRGPEETVQYLADQIETATLAEDKRAAIQTIKGLSRQYKKLVTEIALDPLLKAFIENDPENPKISEYILDTLNYLCSTEDEISSMRPESKGISFDATNRVISTDGVVATIYELLANPEHSVQFAAINLLALFTQTAGEKIQATVLEQPIHVDRIVDLMSSPQDFIRSKTVEVLIAMTQRDKTIQQIVAFKSIFEKIFAIIAEEGGIRGNIVIEDYLTLLKNLLDNNISNQNLFREMSWIKKLQEFIDLDSPLNNSPNALAMVDDDTDSDDYYNWSDEQQCRNMHMALEIVQMLLQPGISSTSDNQNEMQRCGIIPPLLQLALEALVPTAIRAQSLLALGALLSNSKRIQNIFQRTLITSTPVTEDGHEALPTHGKKLIPEPAIVIIIRLAVGPCPATINPHSYFRVRAAATQLIQFYLQNNDDAKLGLAATIIPPPTNPDHEESSGQGSSGGESAGSLVVTALVGRKDNCSADPLRTWFAASLLSVLLHNNNDCKMLALSYKITGSEDEDSNEPIPLINEIAYQCSQFVKKFGISTQPSSYSQIVISYLSLLSVWVYRSPTVVARYLDDGTNYQFLIQLITGSTPSFPLVQSMASFLLGIVYEFNTDPSTNVTRDSLYPILHKQASTDQMLLQVQSLHKHPYFSTARTLSMFPEKVLETSPAEIYFDPTVTEILVEHYETYRRQINTDPKSFPAPVGGLGSGVDASMTAGGISGDQPTVAMGSPQVPVSPRSVGSSTNLSVTASTVGSGAGAAIARATSPEQVAPNQQADIDALKKKLTTRNAKIVKLERTINDLKSQLHGAETAANEATEKAVKAAEETKALQEKQETLQQPPPPQVIEKTSPEDLNKISCLEQLVKDLQAKLDQSEQKAQEFDQQIETLKKKIEESEATLLRKENEWLGDLQMLEDQLEQSQNSNRDLELRLEENQRLYSALSPAHGDGDGNVQESKSGVVDEEREKIIRELKEQLKELETSQEDLMLLLGDQTEKISGYKQKLRELGHVVSDSEDEDEDLDDDDE